MLKDCTIGCDAFLCRLFYQGFQKSDSIFFSQQMAILLKQSSSFSLFSKSVRTGASGQVPNPAFLGAPSSLQLKPEMCFLSFHLIGHSCQNYFYPLHDSRVLIEWIPVRVFVLFNSHSFYVEL